MKKKLKNTRSEPSQNPIINTSPSLKTLDFWVLALSENNSLIVLDALENSLNDSVLLTIKDPKRERKSSRNRRVREIQGYPSGHESGFLARKLFGYEKEGQKYLFGTSIQISNNLNFLILTRPKTNYFVCIRRL